MNGYEAVKKIIEIVKYVKMLKLSIFSH